MEAVKEIGGKTVTINEWVCPRCYELMCNHSGGELEIKTLTNFLNLPCIVCGEKAEHLVSVERKIIKEVRI
jgi:hypothetical protein